MSELMLLMAEPPVMWGLLLAAILLVLLDYLLPVDWLAFLGYLCFALFMMVTIPASPVASAIIGVAVFVGMIVAHQSCFSRFLTNAPHCERQSSGGCRAVD